MIIVTKLIESLIDYSANARSHSEAQIEQLVQSITSYGYNTPIEIGEDNVVISGHARLEACKRLGMKEVPTITLSHLEGTKRKGYILAANKIAMNAGWHGDILRDELIDLKDNDFDMELTGFSADELDDLLAEDSAPEGLTDEDSCPELQKDAITQPGDIWLLGNHRLMCGDSCNTSDIDALMHDQNAQMVFTDPPYRMNMKGGVNQPVGKQLKQLAESIQELCDFDPKEFLNTLPLVFDAKVMNAFIFCNKDLLPDYLKWVTESKYSFNLLFWKKPNPMPLGGSHRPDVEYLIHVRKNSIWNNAVKEVSYSKCLEFNRENDRSHPTIKPVQLIANQILICSKPQGLVVDLFGGSGSTLIACEKTNRKCFIMEKEPNYCDVIVSRYEQFTGKKAVME